MILILDQFFRFGTALVLSKVCIPNQFRSTHPPHLVRGHVTGHLEAVPAQDVEVGAGGAEVPERALQVALKFRFIRLGSINRL